MSRSIQSIPTEDTESSTRQEIWNASGFKTDMDKAFALVDGNITQQSLADSFKKFYRTRFAYNWNQGQWYYFSVTHVGAQALPFLKPLPSGSIG